MDSIPDWDACVQVYQHDCAADPHPPCPYCGRPREKAGGHWRWVQWFQQEYRLWVFHVRCRHCHTVETRFPPWLLPYERCSLFTLQSWLNAVLADGRPVRTAAREWTIELTQLRRRVAHWRLLAPALRQVVAQHGARWGMGLPGADWRPAGLPRSLDWAWLCAAWTVMAVGVYTLAAVVAFPAGVTGLPLWRQWVPEGFPPGTVPIRTHLGRRLGRGSSVRPPPEMAIPQ